MSDDDRTEVEELEEGAEEQPENPDGGEADSDDSGEPEEPKHNFDKGLQRLQQRQAMTERQLQQVLGAVEDLRDSLQNRGDTATADSVTDALDDLADDEPLTKAGVEKLLRHVENSVKKQLDPVVKTISRTNSETATERFWKNWEQQHPEVASQREALIQEAQEQVAEEYSHLDNQSQLAITRARFDDLVKKAEAKARQRKQGEPSGKPRKPTKGTNVTKGGKSSSGRSDERPVGRLYVPASELEG